MKRLKEESAAKQSTEAHKMEELQKLQKELEEMSKKKILVEDEVSSLQKEVQEVALVLCIKEMMWIGQVKKREQMQVDIISRLKREQAEKEKKELSFQKQVTSPLGMSLVV